jgi:hypothetical protein
MLLITSFGKETKKRSLFSNVVESHAAIQLLARRKKMHAGQNQKIHREGAQ